MLIKSALRDLLSLSYDMIRILLIGSLRSPPPIRLRRTSPYSGGIIKHLEASLRKRLYSKHGLLCHLAEGERWWRQPPKGDCISSPAGRLYGFRRQRRYKRWRQRRRTSPAQRYYITPEGGALNPPVRRSRSQAEPWQPRAERPGGWLNPHARKGVSTFGNTGKHRPGPGPGPDPDRAERRLNPHTHKGVSMPVIA